MVLDSRTSADVGLDECAMAVSEGLDSWSHQACSDFGFVDGGTQPNAKVGFDSHDQEANINLITWIESSWNTVHPQPYSKSIVALTTLTYDNNNGEILDADVAFNGQAFRFSTQGSSPDGLHDHGAIDIQSVMAHEAGHVLGLDDLTDTASRSSTMFGKTLAGETSKRSLSNDDIDGLCAIYPKNSSSSPHPQSPSKDNANIPADDSSDSPLGCQHVSGAPSMEFLFFLALLARTRTKALRAKPR